MRGLAIGLAGAIGAASGLLAPLAFDRSGKELDRPAILATRPSPSDAASPGQTNAAAANGEPARSAGKEAPAGPSLAYAPDSGLPGQPPETLAGEVPTVPSPPPHIELAGLAEVIAQYRKGDLAGGDAAAKSHTEPLARLMLEWIALRTNPRDSGFARTSAFLQAHPDWPSAPWLRRRAEELLYADPNASPAIVTAFFAGTKPLGPAGKLALARALLKDGDRTEAANLVRDVWRESDLSVPLEAAVLREFGDGLTAADHAYRAERLLYKEDGAAALRAAARAGPDALALARARVAVIANANTAMQLLEALPAPLKKQAGYAYARAQSLRRAGRLPEAAAVLLAATHDEAKLVDGDAWWAERRLVARKLLDLGDTRTAYRLCAENDAVSPEAKVDAEFHAGWIALRYLDDPAKASAHFARAAKQAQTPSALARAAYWRARAAEAAGDSQAAATLYEKASAEVTSYYGQLARAKLAKTDLPIRETAKRATGDARHESVQVVELLYALGLPDLALPLVIDAAERLHDEAQVAALGTLVSAYHDAHATLAVGKLAENRGFALDDLAFPTFGIPAFEPAPNSADRAVVYSIARQESAFDVGALSSSGAKGLMQLLTSTAREAAQRAHIDFDEAKLTKDGAFNAKLGAAYLGSLLDGERGSLILAFAAYNAGAGRVQQWIAAHGDPREPSVDPIDWIELIPFNETRHYVQAVMENLQVYRLRFGQRTAMLIDDDLRQTAHAPPASTGPVHAVSPSLEPAVDHGSRDGDVPHAPGL
jgi:soluble lytic murein transglycosylase